MNIICQIYETRSIQKDFVCSRLIILDAQSQLIQTFFKTLGLISYLANCQIKYLLTINNNNRQEYKGEGRSENQYGFRKNKRRRQVILDLRIILKKQIKRQKNYLYDFFGSRKSIQQQVYVHWTNIFKMLEETKTDFKDKSISHIIYEEK